MSPGMKPEGQEKDDDEQPDKLVHLHDSYPFAEKGKPKRISKDRPERNEQLTKE